MEIWTFCYLCLLSTATLCVSAQDTTLSATWASPLRDATIYTACPVGSYGPLCMHICKCRNNDSCSVDNGHCPNGCITGYLPPVCSDCDSGFFGPECKPCHCLNGPLACNKQTGHCNGGCVEGYTNPDCQVLFGYPKVESVSYDSVVNIEAIAPITCTVSGAPIPNVTITQHNLTVLSSNEDVNGTEINLTLYVQIPTFPGIVNLTCEAINNHGSINHTFDITIVDPPTLVSPPMVNITSPDTAFLSWNKWEFLKDIGGIDGDVVDYMVLYRMAYSSIDWLDGSTWSGDTFATVAYLMPDSDYEFSVRSRRPGDKGDGPPGPPAQGATPCRAPNSKGIPQNVEVVGVSSNSAVVKWQPPAHKDLGCIVKNYKLGYQLVTDANITTILIDGNTHEQKITNFKPDSEYVLHLSIDTSLGIVTQDITTKFNTLSSSPPEPVTSLKHDPSNSGSTYAMISWSSPRNLNESDIKEYKVNARLLKMGICNASTALPPEFNIVTVTVITTYKWANVTNLYPYSSYNITIQAVSDTIGEINSVAVQTNMSAPGKEPGQVLIKKTGSNDLTFEWDPIPCHLANGALFYRYSLRSTTTRSKRSDTWIVKDKETSDTVVTINDLNPSTTYEFQVKGVTNGGEGPAAITRHSTSPGLPPPRLVVSTRSSDFIMITTGSFSKDVTEYQLKVSTNDSSWPEKLMTNHVLIKLQRVDNMLPDTEYQISVRGKYSVGWGAWSEPLVVRTKLGAPSEVRAQQISYSEIELQWTAPEKIDGGLHSYKIECYQYNPDNKSKELLYSNETSDNDTTKLILESLSDKRSYILRVTAKNNEGYGKPKEINLLMIERPPAPTINMNKILNSSSTYVAWRPPSGGNDILGYKLECVPIDDNSSSNTTYSSDAIVYETSDEKTLNATLYNFQPRLYQLRLMAKTRFGYGYSTTRNFTMGDANSEKASHWKLPIPPTPFVVGVKRNETHLDEVLITVQIFPAKSSVEQEQITYEVVVSESGSGTDLNNSRIETYILAKNIRLIYWVATRIPSSLFSTISNHQFTIGDGKFHGGLLNGKLEASKSYLIMARTYCEAHNTASLLSTPVHVKSRDELDHEAYASECYILGLTCVWFMVIIIAILLIIWIILIVFIIRYRRRRTSSRDIKSRENSKHSDSMAYYPKKMEDDAGLSVVAYHNADENYCKLETFKNTKFFGPIPVNELAGYIAMRTSHPVWKFIDEFREVTQEQRASWDVAKRQENIQKNRYGNILPYDHSRVRLDPLPGVPDSDYINASFIDGYDKFKVYIATQGPKENTFHDFWRMVYQENVATIIMLTALSEHKRKKCDQYWPNHSRLFGDILVTLCETDNFADIVIRHFELKKIGTDEKRLVIHYQCLDWADLDIPPCAASVLSLRRKVREDLPEKSGPIVVHCSGGAGRTGTFIAIDAMLKQAKDEDSVYIFQYVQKIQSQRVHLVQTVDQYKFIYDTILEALQSGDTKVSNNRLSAYYRDIKKDYENGPSEIAEQFNTLNNIEQRKSCFPCPTALDEPNVKKNRNPSIVPVEHSRVRLQSLQDGESPSDDKADPYINAVLCDGFKQSGNFIVTQMPLDNTVEDFWHMITKNNSSVIVMLNDCEFIDEQIAAGQYWPNDGGVQFGSYEVELVSFEEKGMVNVRTLRVTDLRKNEDEPKSVIQLQFLHWTPGEEVPSSKTSLLSLLSMTDVMQRKYGGPITVHCLDGASRSGLFCVCHYVKEQAQSEEIDVFSAVKRLRRHRPEFIVSLKQYQFCYEVVIESLTSV